jgi:hypothetical protein
MQSGCLSKSLAAGDHRICRFPENYSFLFGSNPRDLDPSIMKVDFQRGKGLPQPAGCIVSSPALFETEWEPDRHEPSSNQEYSEFGVKESPIRAPQQVPALQAGLRARLSP